MLVGQHQRLLTNQLFYLGFDRRAKDLASHKKGGVSTHVVYWPETGAYARQARQKLGSRIARVLRHRQESLSSYLFIGNKNYQLQIYI